MDRCANTAMTVVTMASMQTMCVIPPTFLVLEVLQELDQLRLVSGQDLGHIGGLLWVRHKHLQQQTQTKKAYGKRRS